YRVQSIAGEKQWSDVTDAVSITPVDRFPPVVPQGLRVIMGDNAIELGWNRNVESDFQGYNVYRSAGDAPFEKIASLITAPTFNDDKVQAGRKYRYRVTAVDMIGNESMPSETIEVNP